MFVCYSVSKICQEPFVYSYVKNIQYIEILSSVSKINLMYLQPWSGNKLYTLVFACAHGLLDLHQNISTNINCFKVVSIIVIYLGATNTNIDNRIPNWWGCIKYGKSLRSTTTITNMMIRFYSKLLHWVLNIVLKSIDTVQHPSNKIPLIIFYWLTELAIFNSNAQHIRKQNGQKSKNYKVESYFVAN